MGSYNLIPCLDMNEVVEMEIEVERMRKEMDKLKNENGRFEKKKEWQGTGRGLVVLRLLTVTNCRVLLQDCMFGYEYDKTLRKQR